VFTGDLELVRRLYGSLEVGGLVVGDIPTLRFDPMPYGGMKRSGLGREGARDAFDWFTEPKVLLW
jgi:acyl-CoA reductase-like NAD-dependent aldehyde dehydrogenase